MIVCASEVGAVAIDPATIIAKGRLKPGRMLLVDTKEGRIIEDKELKMATATKRNFSSWLDSQQVLVPEIVRKVGRTVDLRVKVDTVPLATDPILLAHGYSVEQLSLLMLPMLKDGKEALGSMGNDAPLACVATSARVTFDYFRQLFAQVTNPSIGARARSLFGSLGGRELTRLPPARQTRSARRSSCRSRRTSGPRATCSTSAPSSATASCCRRRS